MPRVICDLPNAADEISGVKFHPLDDGGRISDEIDEATAAVFASIPGYEIDGEDRTPVAKKQAPAAAPVTRKKAAAKLAETPPPAPAEPEAPPAGAPTGEAASGSPEVDGASEGSGEGGGEGEGGEAVF